MVVGGLFLIPAVGLMVFGRAAHFVFHGREPLPGLFPLLLLLVAGGSLGILGAGGMGLGVGLMQRQAWARVAGIILGVLALFYPPLRTALGVYTLWVLLADEGGDQYRVFDWDRVEDDRGRLERLDLAATGGPTVSPWIT
jgi:hypothetical protein